MVYVDMMQYRFHTGACTSMEIPYGLPAFSAKTPKLQADKYITYISAWVGPCTVLLS